MGRATTTTGLEGPLPPVDARLLAAAVGSTGVGLALLGEGGTIAYVNEALTEAVGRTAESLCGTRIGDLAHPECTSDAAHRLEELHMGVASAYRGECRLRHADGRPIWVLVVARPMRCGEGPAMVVLQATNIDAQKRAELALPFSASRWAFALDAARQGVWEHDRRSGRMFYSPMWRTMRGMAPDEEVDGSQSAWLARMHPDDVPRILATVDRQDRGEDGFDTLEYRERHRDGRWIWILSRGRPVEWDGHGTPIRTLGTDTDITQFKQVEAELAKEKELLKVTLESIGEGVISTDAERRITFVNPMAERLTGWPLAEALGRPVEEVCRLLGTLRHPIDACLTSGTLFFADEDAVLVSRLGLKRDIRSSAAPLSTPDGRPIGAVLVFQDVSVARALQRQLAHSATHDALTTLPNRAAFDTALAAVVAQAATERRHHALCFIDLDHFKPVNDGAGHAAGDALLRQVADQIAANCRPQDFSARIGGDEFAVLLSDCSVSAARRIATRIANAIGSIRFESNGIVYHLGASVGVAPIGGADLDTEEIRRRADEACYRAKAAGRRKVVVWGDPAPAAGSAAR